MNDIITVEDLAGLEALPVGTTFKRIATDTELRITEAGVRRSQPLVFGQAAEWTKAYIADDALPATITNPETLGGDFAGVGDRVRIVEDDEAGFGTDYVGSFGILRQINDQAPENLALRVELEAPVYSQTTHIWVRSVTPAPLPTKPTPQVGDRVRVVREYMSGGGYLDGKVGTLNSISDDEHNSLPYSVDIDDHGHDIVHEVDFEHDPEPTPEYPFVNDEAGFNALPQGSIVVPLDEGLAPRLNQGELGWRAFAHRSMELTDDTLTAVLDQGVLVVYQP